MPNGCGIDYSQTVDRYTLLDAYPLLSVDEQVPKLLNVLCSILSILSLLLRRLSYLL